MGRIALLIRALAIACLVALVSCSHAPPQVYQVFSQVNRVWDPAGRTWSARLSVFVQAASADGTKVFDRLHLIHDGQQIVFTLGANQWTDVTRPGEFWVGSNDLSLADGTVPTGSWRALLVTRSGQRVETAFDVPPPPPGSTSPPSGPVSLAPVPGTPGRWRISGWVDDTLVWFRDVRGAVLNRLKLVGSEVTVPPGVASVLLYSYDKSRGEGLEAGPFPVQDPGKPADR